MVLKDGTYPKYEKIDLDPKLVPTEYWNKSYRCVKCGFRWPHEKNFHKSICCGTETRVIREGPELQWPEAIKQLLNVRFEEFYDKYNSGLSEEAQLWLGEKLDVKDEEISEAFKDLEKGV